MADFMSRWKSWAAGLGGAIVDDGSVLGRSVRLSGSGASATDPGPDRLTGYYLMQADSLESAAELVRGCPIFEVHGAIQVAELMPIALTTGAGEQACA